MKPRSYSSEGIILAKKNFSEADKIFVVYSKEHGRISLVAKGVRRPKSRKRGHLEVFNNVRMQAVIGKGLDLMTEAEVIEDFKEIRNSLKKVSLAYYFVEVIGRITHEHQQNEELYDLLLGYLRRLKTENLLKKLRTSFVTDVLVLLGYWPIGESLTDVDEKLEEVIERKIGSVRVGKILSSA